MLGLSRADRRLEMKPSALIVLIGLGPRAGVTAQTDPHAVVLAADRAKSEVAWNTGVVAAIDRVLADSAVLPCPGARCFSRAANASTAACCGSACLDLGRAMAYRPLEDMAHSQNS
jgi:hypothetical protein